MLDVNSVPQEDGGEPRMISLIRDRKEVTSKSAADGKEATIELMLMLLERREELKIGDIIMITRV